MPSPSERKGNNSLTSPSSLKEWAKSPKSHLSKKSKNQSQSSQSAPVFNAFTFGKTPSAMTMSKEIARLGRKSDYLEKENERLLKERVELKNENQRLKMKAQHLWTALGAIKKCTDYEARKKTPELESELNKCSLRVTKEMLAKLTANTKQ